MGTIYVIGAGPIGLAATAALQRGTQHDIVLFEKRAGYTRDRKVTLSHFLLAEEVGDYTSEDTDADDIRAIFRHDDLEDLLSSKRSIPAEVRAALTEIGSSFVALNTIEETFAQIVSAGRPIDRRSVDMSVDDLISMVEPGDIVLDATGRNSLTRDSLLGPDNTLEFIVEHALVASFAMDASHICTTQCKWSGSIGNDFYDFIPSVRRSHTIAGRTVAVGIVEISDEDFARLPRTLDEEWLTSGDPAAEGIRRYLHHHSGGTSSASPLLLNLMTLPLNLYCAQHFTNLHRPSGSGFPDASLFLLGDAAIGSPYFQSISLGLESTFFLTAALQRHGWADSTVLDRYERFMERQWMRVYMRSRSIKSNKDVLTYVDDIPGLLDRLYVY